MDGLGESLLSPIDSKKTGNSRGLGSRSQFLQLRAGFANCPYEFIGFGALDVQCPCELLGFITVPLLYMRPRFALLLTSSRN